MVERRRLSAVGAEMAYSKYVAEELARAKDARRAEQWYPYGGDLVFNIGRDELGRAGLQMRQDAIREAIDKTRLSRQPEGDRLEEGK
jgi:hypothetical protein